MKQTVEATFCGMTYEIPLVDRKCPICGRYPLRSIDFIYQHDALGRANRIAYICEPCMPPLPEDADDEDAWGYRRYLIDGLMRKYGKEVT